MLETPEFVTTLLNVIKDNPVVASLYGLYGMALLTYVLRDLPRAVFNTVLEQCTTSLVITSNLTAYDFIQGWLHARAETSIFQRFARNYMFGLFGNKRIGFGEHCTHWLTYKNRLFNVVIKRDPLTHYLCHSMKITCYGRDVRILEDMLREAVPHEFNEQDTRVFSYAMGWEEGGTIKRRGKSRTVLSPEVDDAVFGSIERFTKSRAWYEDKGFAYKLTLVLYGPPGTGKTSIAREVAERFDRKLCCLSLSSMTDLSINAALRSLPRKSVVLIEDFDTHKSTHSRGAMSSLPIMPTNPMESRLRARPSPDEVAPTQTKPTDAQSSGLTLSGLLNTLDGASPLEDVIILMTTNCIDDIDPALLRKGRTDKTVFIPKLTHPEVVRYIKMVFPEQDPSLVDSKVAGLQFADIAGCDLQSLLFDCPDDVDCFIRSIPVVD